MAHARSQKKTKLTKVDRQIARSYLVEAQRSLSRRTLANQVSALRCFYQFCQTRGWANSNPFKNLSLPKARKISPQVFDLRNRHARTNDSPEPRFTKSPTKLISWLRGTGSSLNSCMGLDCGLARWWD